MEELKDRIKKARKDAGFKSQEKFAEFLGTSRDAIATYESGRVIPNDIFIQLMATKLNVSEEWLRTGEGEMMSQKSKSIVDELSAIYRLDERRKRLLGNFLSLNDEDQEKLIGAIEVVASMCMCEGAQKEKAAPEISEAEYEKAQAIVDAYRAQKNEYVKKGWPTSTPEEDEAG